MKHMSITVVRIYLSEEETDLHALLTQLHDIEKVQGVTVFRGISGYGESGKIHSASLIDTAFNLPIVVEFYDDTERARQIMKALQKDIKPKHMIYWQANQWESMDA